MAKPTLDLNSLEVDTFTTDDSSEIGNDINCTGCDSGCGIIWP